MLTIFLPTHNRPNYLRRTLIYLAIHAPNIKLLIADSSKDEIFYRNQQTVQELLKSSSVTHLDYRAYDVYSKFIYGLSKITTPFVMPCGDDDFLIYNQAIECVKFLDKNNDYSIAHGKIYTFILNDKNNISRLSNYPQNENSEILEKRVISHYKNYTNTFYSVHRTSSLLNNINEISSLSCGDGLKELALSVLDVIQGKRKMFNDPFLFRQKGFTGWDEEGNRSLPDSPLENDYLTATGYGFDTYKEYIINKIKQVSCFNNNLMAEINSTIDDDYKNWKKRAAAYMLGEQQASKIKSNFTTTKQAPLDTTSEQKEIIKLADKLLSISLYQSNNSNTQNAHKRKVIYLRSNILPTSEIFIKEQILSLQTHHGILIGEILAENGPSLNEIDHTIHITDTYKAKQQRRIHQLPDQHLLRLIQKITPSIIHCQFGTDAVEHWPTITNLNLPVIVHLRGYDITTYKEYWKNQKETTFAQYYPDRLIQMSQDLRVKFIAVSNAIKNRAIEYGIDESKITVIYSGVDTNKFNYIDNINIGQNKNILFVGRLVEKKGIIYLLKAFNKIAKHIPETKLIIAGDGPLYYEAVSYAKENQLNTLFLGSISHQMVFKEMQKARIFCLPSITASNGDREGLPNVIKEAQLCGIPVITSAFGGATEGIINNETGFSFPEKNIDELAEKILLLSKDDKLVWKMSSSAVEFAKHRFDIRKCTMNLESYYNEIITNYSS